MVSHYFQNMAESYFVSIYSGVEISVGFTIVTPGSLDPGMHFSLEVKWDSRL